MCVFFLYDINLDKMTYVLDTLSLTKVSATHLPDVPLQISLTLCLYHPSKVALQKLLILTPKSETLLHCFFMNGN